MTTICLEKGANGQYVLVVGGWGSVNVSSPSVACPRSVAIDDSEITRAKEGWKE